MNISSWVTQYVVAAIAFCIIDFLWLGTIAKKVYDEARKPHNQAKIRAAVQKVQERRGGKRY